MQTKSIWNGKEINLTSDDMSIKSTNFNVDKNGNMTCNNATITGGAFNVQTTTGSTDTMKITNKNNTSEYSYMGPTIVNLKSSSGEISMMPKCSYSPNGSNIQVLGTNVSTLIWDNGITTPKLTQTSLKSKKKNIKKLKVNATELIKKADVCLYNIKGEKSKSKKHIGLIIGKGYNCPMEVISEDGQGVEQYSMTSLAWKAIQEQQDIIQEQNNLIQDLLARVEKLEKGEQHVS